MRTKKVIGVIIIFVLLFSFWFFYLKDARENKLISEGNAIVERIYEYQKEMNKLPSSLSDVGIKEVSETEPPLYYDKIDSLHFTLSFGRDLGESKIYYSDSKQWESFNRAMK